MKIRSLAELGALREAVRSAERAAAEQRQREAAQRRQRERQVQAEHQLFARAVGLVHPLRDRGLAELDLPRPPPLPRQRELDEQAALAATMSDEVTLESLLLTDDGLSFRRAGIGPDVVNKLRRGHWALQGQLDLHGHNRDQARELLASFIRDSHRRGMRCVRVVHGKGNGSPGRQPVLKGKVQKWLAQCAEVIAFAQATGPQGGAGALVVLLAGS
ncbi:Smr/MutS family protein [Aquabacterium sp. OR-4]|uniref:Smr/MutS family protein n=1 Tax=Aquabacterium sp. OR-4 TaxID=2978127 RepID=UPI0021B38C03|nr:Smr/MutS family protein [Aquabacterium sp. OR-4]MDT7836642.1 Smr/MutS family protein [Aquabacterium sp. OR-4]